MMPNNSWLAFAIGVVFALFVWPFIQTFIAGRRNAVASA